MVEKRVTLKDVAKYAGVSIGTASKVINNIYVRPKLRIKVEEAMKKFNYTPNTIARSLKIKSTHTVGVIISDISSPVASKIVTGIQEVGNMYGYSVMLYDTKMRQADEITAINLFANKMVDGILFTSNTVTKPIAELLKRLSIPVVLIATKDEDDSFSSVTIDNELAAYTAVKYLCQLQHRKIAMLSGRIDDPNSGIPRLTGYKKAIAEFDMEFNEKYISFGDYRFEDGYEGMKRILNFDDSVTAVFAASDEMAIGATKAIKEKNLCIPEDISVMGFDGIDVINYITPTISTVHQPLYEFGVEGMKILLDKIKNNKRNVNITLDFQLVKNGSCAKRNK